MEPDLKTLEHDKGTSFQEIPVKALGFDFFFPLWYVFLVPRNIWEILEIQGEHHLV